jgi:hypothetical protein
MDLSIDKPNGAAAALADAAIMRNVDAGHQSCIEQHVVASGGEGLPIDRHLMFTHYPISNRITWIGFV